MARTKSTFRDTTTDPGIARAYLNSQSTAKETLFDNQPDAEINPSTDLACNQSTEANMRLREQDKQKKKKKRGDDLPDVDSPSPRGTKHLGVEKRGETKTPKQSTLPQSDGQNENEIVEEESIPIQENEIEQEPNQSEEDSGESEEKDSEEEEEESAEEETAEEETTVEVVPPLSEEQPSQTLALPSTEPRLERKATKPRQKAPEPKGKHISAANDETFWLPKPPKGINHWGEAPDKNKVLFGYP